jgi:phosphate:Na+ symporter
LSRALGNRFAALAAGLGLTALLQSSTATALMMASFSAEGTIALVPALAIMLGANVGTTLIVQVLSFSIAGFAPLLFILGLVSFRSGGRSRLKDLGRVSIGLGLILLSLHFLLDTLAPAEQAPAVRTVLGSVTGDPLLCVLVAAAMTWAAHSSVAIVLLVMSLAYSSFISPTAALALVLGANLGSAINPLLEGARRGDPVSYRLPVGDLLNRFVGTVLVLPFLEPIARLAVGLQPDMARMAAGFHVVFNVALAMAFLPLLGPMARLLERLFQPRRAADDPAEPRYLD